MSNKPLTFLGCMTDREKYLYNFYSPHPFFVLEDYTFLSLDDYSDTFYNRSSENPIKIGCPPKNSDRFTERRFLFITAYNRSMRVINDEPSYHEFIFTYDKIEHTIEWTNRNPHLHRLCGPAKFIYKNGMLRSEEWYINGHRANESYLKWCKDNDINIKKLTDEDKILIHMKWGGEQIFP